MADTEKSARRELWDMFFSKTWPMWVGGLLLAMLNICLFLVKSPWGGSGSYINWGENLYHSLGLLDLHAVKTVPHHLYGMLGLMTVLGAFSAALMAREFAVRVPPPGEMLKGFIGGSLMAIGSTVGIGCTVGGFLSGWPALSGGAIFLAIGFGIGCFIALRYLFWEMEHAPGMSAGKSFTWLAASGKSGAWQPVLGLIVFLVLIIGGTLYYKTNPVFTWFAVIGVLLGFINQRARFCVTRAFREPFMTGESEAPVAIMGALLVGLFGFTVIKYMGVGASTPGAARILALTWVYPHFWLRALIGGTIFGLGMTVAGGCAVGTLWRTGEGQVKLWIAALGFLLVAPISKKFIVPAIAHILPEWAKKKVFLPDTFGYGGAVLLFVVIILLWFLFVKWNERTGKFSAL